MKGSDAASQGYVAGQPLTGARHNSRVCVLFQGAILTSRTKISSSLFVKTICVEHEILYRQVQHDCCLLFTNGPEPSFSPNGHRQATSSFCGVLGILEQGLGSTPAGTAGASGDRTHSLWRSGRLAVGRPRLSCALTHFSSCG